ncbi:peptidylprolyl isomerase [bacterium SCSIO 12643]|nr:peptidylprolyl isomerase [bacterium SCSIO 12643]
MNLKHVLTGVALIASSFVVAQNEDDVLLTIEGNDITVSEFMAIYNKNNVEIESADKKSVEDYLDLYLNFKLKVHEAEVQGYDTVPAFQNELGGYVNQLAAPYLVDNQFTEDLIKEAYERSKWEIKASHIMIKIPENPTPKDTANAWIKINQIYKEALTDSNFADLAVKYSDDPSVTKNGGDLGYFSAFRMVYPFESAAYKTEVGSVSKPIRTSYGYHVIKVEDKRPASGEIKAAHIMVISNDKSTPEEAAKAKKKITEIYQKLQAGEPFTRLANTYSDDRGSAQKGGDLGWFGAGRMVPDFEAQAFALKNNGDYSEPFLTQFGWHIVMREDKRNIGSYEEEYDELEKKVKKDRRSLGSEHALVTKLMKEYKVKIKTKSKDAFYTVIDSSYFEGKWELAKAEGLDAAMMTINDKKYGKKKVTYTQADFAKYLSDKMRNRKAESVPLFIDKEFDKFVDLKMIAYEKSILSYKYPEYKALLTEYHDGILLFEIMEKEVWKKAMQDSTGLEAYYDKHKSEYMWNERLNAKQYICDNKEIADMVALMIKENKSDSTIMAMMNKNSELAVNIREGKYEIDEEPYFAEVERKPGVSIVDNKDNVIVVEVMEVLPSQEKQLDEVRGLITSAYQDQLDKEWIEALRVKYSYTINKEVLSTLN